MAWDFSTEPEFQAQLDWFASFVRDEIWPLETLDLDRAQIDRALAPLQEQVRERGLWAAHLSPELGGQGFGQVKLGLMHEILGSSPLGPSAFGNQPPDSGNSELIALAGSEEQKERWLAPLLAGDLRSAFSMTEPAVAGADPTTIETRAVLDEAAGEWVIDGHKWFSSNGSVADFLIVMAVTDPQARGHGRASMFIVPAGTPGVRMLRDVPTMEQPAEHFGLLGGHAEIVYEGVRRRARRGPPPVRRAADPERLRPTAGRRPERARPDPPGGRARRASPKCSTSSRAMTDRRRLICAALVAVLIIGGLTACGTDDSATQPAAIPASLTTLAPRATVNRFDGRGAFVLLREQVQDYGWRPAGSAALRRLAVRLRTLMPRGRLENVPGHPGLRNVVGSVPGRMPAIVVGAHYDVEAEPEGFVGANDGAAGTAAVVTLARAFARAPRPRNARALRFVLFDGEEEPAGCEPFIECGLRGSTAYAERHAGETRALVLLDYIAERQGLRFTREAGSDPALWSQLRTAARAVGVGSLFTGAVSGEIIDDHTPFTQRGVRAIDLIDFDYPQRDSLADNLDAVSERSLDAVGEAVHRLVTGLRAQR